METKFSDINVAMSRVLRDAQPRDMTREWIASNSSLSLGVLDRILGKDPAKIRDVTITQMYELADLFGIPLVDLVKKAESRMSAAPTTTDEVSKRRAANSARTAEEIDRYEGTRVAERDEGLPPAHGAADSDYDEPDPT